jgi:DNA invertase Pin-like site-specific DNA recombinase
VLGFAMIVAKKQPIFARAVLYTRVSSKDQQEEGFSIPAQQRLLREYASASGIIVAAEFMDVETARRSGREGFGQMLAYLKKHERSCRTILVEKTDRLYRNIRDYATVDELGLTIHFVKENVVISPESRSAEQFMHGIKVLMARNYSQNLGEETLKGMTEKARAGIYPSFAPVGYQNVDGPNGKRIIAVHADEAPIVSDLFAQFATGNYSLKTLALHVRGQGFTLRGRKLYVSTLHQILRKRIYTGNFDFNGNTYQGSHEPLITTEVWDRVQRILNERKEHQTKGVRREFPFTGLISCGHCGLRLVAELKKGRYVYYHCTGHRGKCPEPYTRQETLVNEFASTLGELVVPQEVLDWLAREVTNTDQTQQAARATTIKRHEAELARLQYRLNTLYEDRLDGRITKTFYDEKSRTISGQIAEVERKLTAIRAAELPPLTTALDILRLTSRACHAFRAQPEAEQRKLLTMMLKEAQWKEGRLHTTLLEPFELLRCSNHASSNGINGKGGAGTVFEIWLLR